jgi:hypothetical protein
VEPVVYTLYQGKEDELPVNKIEGFVFMLLLPKKRI